MSTQSKPLKIIFGTATFGFSPAQEYLDVLTRYNVVDLDTARTYVRAPQSHAKLQGGKVFY